MLLARKMLFTVLTLYLAVANGIFLQTTITVDSDMNRTLEAKLEPRETPLNDMFGETDTPMEDTKHKLEDAVNQMDNESAQSSSNDMSSNYNNENNSTRMVGNKSVSTVELTDQDKANLTGVSHLSESFTQSSDNENDIDHECSTDPDCQENRYCLLETQRSRCLPCKALDMSCTKDEHCCSGHLCVWGQCSHNATKGEAGSICHYQSDCSSHLCCALHKALLFTVCSAKPMERERCQGPSNHLLDREGHSEAPLDYCPCAGDLQCQPLGRGSLCLQPQNSSEEDLTDSLYSEIDYIV